MPPFTVTHRDGAARRGVLTTAHGLVETPVFMPVGTQGVVKATTPRDLVEVGASIILGNTYHLHLRPGDELIRAAAGSTGSSAGIARSSPTAAGIRCSAWPTDARLTDEGVEFQSHLDGSRHLLTPESAADIQTQPRLGHRHGPRRVPGPARRHARTWIGLLP